MLGVLKQDYLSFWFTTARNNVAFGDVSRPYDEDRFQQALVRAEAKSFVDRLPQGSDTFVDKWAEDDDGNPGTDLSGDNGNALYWPATFIEIAQLLFSMNRPVQLMRSLRRVYSTICLPIKTAR